MILDSINRSLKKHNKLSNIQTSIVLQKKQEQPETNVQSQGSQNAIDDQAETNTVIENECENDYTNIYSSDINDEHEEESIPNTNKEQSKQVTKKRTLQRNLSVDDKYEYFMNMQKQEEMMGEEYLDDDIDEDELA